MTYKAATNDYTCHPGHPHPSNCLFIYALHKRGKSVAKHGRHQAGRPCIHGTSQSNPAFGVGAHVPPNLNRASREPGIHRSASCSAALPGASLRCGAPSGHPWPPRSNPARPLAASGFIPGGEIKRAPAPLAWGAKRSAEPRFALAREPGIHRSASCSAALPGASLRCGVPSAHPCAPGQTPRDLWSHRGSSSLAVK
jgi:hypothetical protein